MAVQNTGSARDLSKQLSALAMTSQYDKGEEVCGQGEPADTWYHVVKGATRRCMVCADGRRRIVGLLLPGDCFGFTLNRGSDCSVESVMDGTIVASIPRRRAEMLADSDPIVAREIRELAFTVIAQLQTQLLVVGRTTAREKVGSFLFEMSHRLERDDGGRVVLPVSRYDIADYLAISAEAVSRSISRLRGLGLINLAEPRHVRILNNSGLRNYEHPVHPRAST